MIHVDKLDLKKGSFELKDISFTLKDHENLLITGPSGSGKTILAEALAGKRFSGNAIHVSCKSAQPLQIVFVGQREAIKSRSNIMEGYYQQRYNSFDSENSYTVSELLLRINNDLSEIDKLLTQFDVLYLKDRPLLQLSSGEHKRFQLVQALLQHPDILIMDEPFLGLDQNSRKTLNQLLSEMTLQGCQIVLVSQHTIPDCITHVFEMNAGRQKNFLQRQDFKPSSTTVNQLKLPDFPPLKDPKPFENAVIMKNVSAKYGEHQIFDRINWQVKRGDCWLIKGKNGAGKSTLLSLILGDNPQAYSKEIYLFDRRRGTGESIWDIKKNIGYISPELFAFFDKNISCYNTVASGFFDTMGVYQKIDGRQQKLVWGWLKAFNLETFANQQLAAVPSGKQRLLLLSRALIKNPPLLVFDEPCQGLDRIQTHEFLSLVDQIYLKFKTTIIYVSHYDDEVPHCINQTLNL